MRGSVKRRCAIGLVAGGMGALAACTPTGPPGDAFLSQSGAAPGSPETSDHFGDALAIGDFNGDGFDDAAIGVPGEAIGNRSGAGAVNIYYGSASGLTTAGSQFFSQDTAGVAGTAETGDKFGKALAAGDFTGDGRDDLAIGAPGEAIGSIGQAGMVHVLVGANTGLSSNGTGFHQNSPGIDGDAESGDQFGASLAAGDVNGGADDLLIGVPREDVGTAVDAGAAHFINGGGSNPGGLIMSEEFLFHQGSSGIATSPQESDLFGWSIAVGDLTGDGWGDVAISAVNEAVDGGEGTPARAAGIVHVIAGSATGPQLGSGVQNENGIDMLSDPTNRAFGLDLAIRTGFGSNPDDLVIGVSNSIQGTGGGAELWRLNGGSHGTLLDVEIGHDPVTVPGKAVAGRKLGFYSNETNGVLVGIPNGNDDGVYAGVVAGWGFDQIGQSDTAGTPEAGDHFGNDLAVGDFDGDGIDDLLIGVRDEDIGSVVDAGGAVAAYGATLGSPFD